MFHCFLIFFLAWMATSISAQQIKLQILDPNKEPLESTSVMIIQDDSYVNQLFSDDQGMVVIEGKYKLSAKVEISFPGFKTKTVGYTQLSVDALNVIRLEYDELIPELTVLANTFQFGEISMLNQQYKFMPASFQDPTRVLIKYPGFSVANDGANAYHFRFMPVEVNRWNVMGADVVNPNHLSEAGTMSAFGAYNSGGINALNGSVLGRFSFKSNPADVSQANVLSGIANLDYADSIRNYAELSFIGLDAGINLSKGERKTFVSYRYSFIGFLENLGVNFGDESINYQDLNVVSDLFKTKYSNLRAFATLGRSSNFKPVLPREDWSDFEDDAEIDFKTLLMIAGLQYEYKKGNKSFGSTLNVSSREDDWRRETYYEDVWWRNRYFLNKRKINETMVSSHSHFKWGTNSNHLIVGLRANYHKYRAVYEVYNWNPNNNYDKGLDYITIYPYAQYHFNYREFEIDLGGGLFYDNWLGQRTFEPYAKISRNVFGNWYAEIASRFSTQMQHPEFYIPMYERDLHYRHRVRSFNNQFTLRYKAHNSMGGIMVYNNNWNNSTSYAYFDEPINNNMLTPFFAFNPSFPNDYRRFRGVDVFYSISEHIGTNKLELMTSLSGMFYEYWSGDDSPKGITGANANISYKINSSTGTWTLGTSYHYAKYRVHYPDRFILLRYGVRIPNEFEWFDYNRVDLRVTREVFNSQNQRKFLIFLDIQNVANIQNPGFFNTNPYLLDTMEFYEPEIKNQLGMIPVFGFRYEW
jgi:hypothetical protein